MYLQVDNLRSYNWENALLGMRNPLESWARSDSKFDEDGNLIKLGEEDKTLAMKLIKAGPDHRKFLRQIFISFVLTAPVYFLKEFDTYKIGTTWNSTSTMHKLTSRPLDISDFCINDISDPYFLNSVKVLNDLIEEYNELCKKDFEDALKVWRKIIQYLPMSYKYVRSCTMNYETLRNMYRQRKHHKLEEWHNFKDWMINGLPYPEFFTENA